MTFTKAQESVIVDIIKKYIKDIKVSSNDEVVNEVVCGKENIDKSKEAIKALSNLQRFRKK